MFILRPWSDTQRTWSSTASLERCWSALSPESMPVPLGQTGRADPENSALPAPRRLHTIRRALPGGRARRGQLRSLPKARHLSCESGHGPCAEGERAVRGEGTARCGGGSCGTHVSIGSRMEGKRTEPGASLPGFESQLLHQQRDRGSYLTSLCSCRVDWDNNPLMGLLEGVIPNQTPEQYLA